MHLFGTQVDTAGVGGWLIAAGLLAIGGPVLRAQPAFRHAWDEAEHAKSKNAPKGHA